MLPNAGEIARRIRERQASARDVLEEILARIAEHDPRLHAIVTLDPAGARKRADEADRALARGEVWGPLHGVPITIKDAFETAGMRTTSGHPAFARHVPDSDAPPVAALRRAGAIILGKTNLPPLASGIQTDNRLFGRTNNPWDLARTPGGSSGGSAAAVAAGLTYLDLGSDIGGSIRIPAHFCGVYGLKATGGRVSGKGHIASRVPLTLPAKWAPLLQLAAIGPLARSIDDLRLALSIIAEPSAPRPRALRDLRIAWTEDFGGAPLDGDSRRVLRALADALDRAGCRIIRREDPGIDFDEAWRVSGACLAAVNSLFQSRTARVLRRLGARALRRFGPRDPLLRGLYEGLALGAGQVDQLLALREALIERVERFLGGWDAWIVPVFPTPAFTHRSSRAPIEVDDRRVAQLRANLLHAIVFNVTGSPVVTIPAGRSAAGMPIGAQLVGRRGQEADLLDVADAVADVTPGCVPPPGY